MAYHCETFQRISWLFKQDQGRDTLDTHFRSFLSFNGAKSSHCVAVSIIETKTYGMQHWQPLQRLS
jgi:hypothetical protein